MNQIYTTMNEIGKLARYSTVVNHVANCTTAYFHYPDPDRSAMTYMRERARRALGKHAYRPLMYVRSRRHVDINPELGAIDYIVLEIRWFDRMPPPAGYLIDSMTTCKGWHLVKEIRNE